MSSLRIRRSIAELDYLHKTGQDPSLLENVIRAFRGIMDKAPDDPDSFFMLAGFHGEPFRGYVIVLLPNETQKIMTGGV